MKKHPRESAGMAVHARRLAVFLWMTTLGGCEVIASTSGLMGCAFRHQLEIQPGELSAARINMPYRATIDVVAGSGPVSNIWATDLPAGMELSHVPRENYAELIGTPRQIGNYKIQVSAATMGTMCAGQHAQREISLQVTP
ncbi:hypothetical protein [Burkholderia seminalis]|uniref:hypothetical protein n=1 Tax=Burkholderia seminalis TaxID=488731 RepID=UPI0019083491|nr:hypothetical protein [Burkholderia seminalis]MBJ9965621.1 hypothetical protein [Burkholderia seminalis]MDN7586834.1 hypothetical protein [Burkholderia seminalis]